MTDSSTAPGNVTGNMIPAEATATHEIEWMVAALVVIVALFTLVLWRRQQLSEHKFGIAIVQALMTVFTGMVCFHSLLFGIAGIHIPMPFPERIEATVVGLFSLSLTVILLRDNLLRRK